ncbi:unnamed protein product [Brassica oleracea var. botrytis]
MAAAAAAIGTAVSFPSSKSSASLPTKTSFVSPQRIFLNKKNNQKSLYILLLVYLQSTQEACSYGGRVKAQVTTEVPVKEVEGVKERGRSNSCQQIQTKGPLHWSMPLEQQDHWR